MYICMYECVCVCVCVCVLCVLCVCVCVCTVLLQESDARRLRKSLRIKGSQSPERGLLSALRAPRVDH